MIYLDSNIFIFACLNSDELGERSRQLLRSVEQGNTEAATSTLSFDEIVWAVKKYRGVKEAIAAGEAFVNMLGLVLIPADEPVIRLSIDLMKRYSFDPRDAIHAASAILCRAESLVSMDSHLDKLEELPRKQV